MEPNAKIRLSEHDQHRVAKYYAKLMNPLREIARRNGYALAVHGSIKRDIDLVAIPWTDEAVDAPTLAEALRNETSVVLGFGGYFGSRCDVPGEKPHGRRCWTIHFGCTYIDLSIMPRVEP